MGRTKKPPLVWQDFHDEGAFRSTFTSRANPELFGIAVDDDGDDNDDDGGGGVEAKKEKKKEKMKEEDRATMAVMKRKTLWRRNGKGKGGEEEEELRGGVGKGEEDEKEMVKLQMEGTKRDVKEADAAEGVSASTKKEEERQWEVRVKCEEDDGEGAKSKIIGEERKDKDTGDDKEEDNETNSNYRSHSLLYDSAVEARGLEILNSSTAPEQLLKSQMQPEDVIGLVSHVIVKREALEDIDGKNDCPS